MKYLYLIQDGMIFKHYSGFSFLLHTSLINSGFSSTHSCRVCSSSRAILSSLISACRFSIVGSSLWVTALPSTTTLGAGGRTIGGVLGRSGFTGNGKRFSVPCNELGSFA